MWLQQPTTQPQPTPAGQPQPSRTQDDPQSARQCARKERNKERARNHQLSLQYKKLAGCKLRLLLLRAMKALRFQRMWEVANPVLQARIAQRTVAHFVRQMTPGEQEPTVQATNNTCTAVSEPALRHASPPRAAVKRTVDERSPEKEGTVEEPSALDDLLDFMGIEEQPRALPPRRLTYALAAGHAGGGPSFLPKGGGANRPEKQRRARGT